MSAAPAKLVVPELCLVVLIGASGAGKSTLARRLFRPTEVVSSDFCRGLVSDDENDQSASRDAFAVLHFIAARRLARGLLTVVDATNVRADARRPLLELAREHDVLPVAIVLDTPAAVCLARNRERPDRVMGPHVVNRQIAELRRSRRALEREGFRHVHVLAAEQLDEGGVAIERQPLWNNRRDDHGPFDIVGDVHGCYDELVELLTRLGYDVTDPARVTPPPGRKAVFVGDLVDRGPGVVPVLRLVMSMVAAGTALAVAGNHDVKLLRKLRGREVTVAHGLGESLAQLAAAPEPFVQEVAEFLDGLVSHYVFDGGRLAVAHAGLKESYIGRASARVRAFALYGDTTGESDELGLPIRYPWAADYRGRTAIVYGHTPVPRAEWLNNTLNIDTGCVFGGSLTALRYPGRELVAVPARRAYVAPGRPFLPPAIAGTGSGLAAQQVDDAVLDLADVSGKRILETRLQRTVTIHEDRAAAALEVMSRFAIDPRWLIYLPPTMAPTATTRRAGLLEHPQEAFDHFRAEGITHLVCEEKHMGSRAVVVACRDAAAARQRFGVEGAERGVVYTRTGRPFFADAALTAQLVDLVCAAAAAAGLWEELATDWLCLDCELMPWSVKAQDLLRGQYAAVGAAARADVDAALGALAAAGGRGGSADATGDGEQTGAAAEAPGELAELTARWRGRRDRIGRYVDAYRRYCWPVAGFADLKLAPFHLLASEGRVHVDRNHLWHLGVLARLVAAAPGTPLIATAHREIDLDAPADVEAGYAWWEALTAAGGEGMVVKPLDFLSRGRRGLAQPAVKCRGAEYLRIIYGAEYDAPENLERLRGRNVGGKRSLALRELALGVEALERFVQREPLRRVHECVWGILALESEPVDPRL